MIRKGLQQLIVHLHFLAHQADFNAEPKGKFITVNGHTIFIEDKGQGAATSGKETERSYQASPGTNTDAKPAPSPHPKETPEELAARTERIMGKLPKIQEAMPGMRKQVETDLQGAGASRDRVGATVVRIMDATTMRVGSEKYANKSATGQSGQDSFGASSLRKSHVSVEGDTVTFKFPGKSRKDWERSVTDPALVASVKYLMSLPGDRLMQYEDGKGNLKPFTERHAGEYLAAHGITPKNLRTYHATRLAHETLQSMGPPKDEAEAKRNINEAVQRVSEHLGNTPAIARQSYINPTVLENYAKAAGKASFSQTAQPQGKTAQPQGKVDFAVLLASLEARVKRGELTGEDPFPEDRGELVEEDDEDGLDEAHFGTNPNDPEASLAAARAATHPAPSDGQKRADNYSKGRFRLHGMGIALETPKGGTRSGVGPDGKPWSMALPHDYGHFEHGDGFDGDKLDAIIGPDLDSELVHVIDQVHPTTGEFDEHKVVLGARSASHAAEIYNSLYAPGWKGMKAVHPMTLPQFKDWVGSGAPKKGPVTDLGTARCSEHRTGSSGATVNAIFTNAVAIDGTVAELAEFARQPGFIAVWGKVSHVGDYPDKKITLTHADFDRAAASSFSLPMNDSHQARTVFTGDKGKALRRQMFGELLRVERRGDELWGEFLMPETLAKFYKESGKPPKVSAEWNIATKRLTGCAWEDYPRIPDATIAPFSARVAPSTTPPSKEPPMKLLQKILNILPFVNAADPAAVAAFSELAAEAEDTPEKTTVASFTDSPEYKAMQASIAENQKLLEAQRAELLEATKLRLTSQAATFTAQLIREKKVLPSEEGAVMAQFARAIDDDMKSPETVSFTGADGTTTEVNRFDGLKRMLEARPSHVLTDELLDDGSAANGEGANFSADEKAKLQEAKDALNPRKIYTGGQI